MLFDRKANSVWKYLNKGRGKEEKEESGKNPLCKPNKMYKIWSCPWAWNNRELLKDSEQGRVE